MIFLSMVIFKIYDFFWSMFSKILIHSFSLSLSFFEMSVILVSMQCGPSKMSWEVFILLFSKIECVELMFLIF